MVNETKYGVISDVHNGPGIVPLVVEVLKSLGAEKLLINGDIGNRQKTIEESQKYVALILKSVAESGLESYVQPGSHETFLAFDPVVDYFASKYPNIIKISKPMSVKEKNHYLIFLPGSDWNANGGEYHIGNDEKISSGAYVKIEGRIIPLEEFVKNHYSLQMKGVEGIVKYSNMNDLRKIVKDPDKSIVVCHVPRKFNNLEEAVDMAVFGEAQQTFSLNGYTIEKGSIFPGPIGAQLATRGYPVEVRKENRGNEDLKSLYEELGITKAVSGHFHESGHRANDTKGNHVSEGIFVKELFWNSGWFDSGQTGILTVKDGKVKYENINLEDYLRQA